MVTSNNSGRKIMLLFFIKMKDFLFLRYCDKEKPQSQKNHTSKKWKARIGYVNAHRAFSYQRTSWQLNILASLLLTAMDWCVSYLCTNADVLAPCTNSITRTILEIRLGHKCETLMNGVSALIKTGETVFLFSVLYSRRWSLWNPGSGSSQRADLLGTLISKYSPSKWEKLFSVIWKQPKSVVFVSGSPS